MSSPKFPMLSDPMNTFKEWAASLSAFFTSYNSRFKPLATWEPSLVNPLPLTFADFRPLQAEYTVTNGFCFFSLVFRVRSDIISATNFTVNLPLPVREGYLVNATGWRDPKLPPGSADNGVVIMIGTTQNVSIYRVDLSTFPLNQSFTFYFSGFYEIN